MNRLEQAAVCGLYRPHFAHDNCGFNRIAQIDGESSHQLMSTLSKLLKRLICRGVVVGDGKTAKGGCGILLCKPKNFLQKVAQRCHFDLTEQLAVGNIFLSRNQDKAGYACDELNTQIQARCRAMQNTYQPASLRW